MWSFRLIHFIKPNNHIPSIRRRIFKCLIVIHIGKYSSSPTMNKDDSYWDSKFTNVFFQKTDGITQSKVRSADPVFEEWIKTSKLATYSHTALSVATVWITLEGTAPEVRSVQSYMQMTGKVGQDWSSLEGSEGNWAGWVVPRSALCTCASWNHCSLPGGCWSPRYQGTAHLKQILAISGSISCSGTWSQCCGNRSKAMDRAMDVGRPKVRQTQGTAPLRALGTQASESLGHPTSWQPYLKPQLSICSGQNQLRPRWFLSRESTELSR